jgi:Tfp pilus assembly PilM family ATPase
MPKRCIGIDIGRVHVCAAQVARTAEGLRLEKAFAMQTRRSTDSLAAILHSLTDRHGFDRRADVAIALPQQVFFFADIETDAGGLDKIRALDTVGLKDYFPIPADDIVAQVCSVLGLEGGKSSVLVAASSRGQLREGLRPLLASRIKPTRLDTPVTAAHATILTNHPESAGGLAILLNVDSATLSLAVTREGSILLVRNIPMFSSDEQDAETFAQQTADIVAQEIEITWRRLFDGSPDPGVRIFMIAPQQRLAALTASIQDKTGSQIIPVNPCARVARSEGIEADLPLCVAEGLALRVLQPGNPKPIDFLAAYQARTRPRLCLKKELTVCAGLAAAAAIVWVAGLFLQLSSLESSYGQLRKQAEEVFRQAVPEEENIVDPVAQLQQRLDAFRKEDALTSLRPGRPSPLEVLYALSRNTPAATDLKLQEVLIAPDSVRITGTCDTFTTLSEWQRVLGTIPGLRVKDVPSQARDPRTGKVTFTIYLSTEESRAS